MVNKVIISVHFFDYLVIIISNIFTSYYAPTEIRDYEISYIGNIAIIFVCNVIFGLIINQLATKIIAMTTRPSHMRTLPLIDTAPSDPVD